MTYMCDVSDARLLRELVGVTVMISRARASNEGQNMQKVLLATDKRESIRFMAAAIKLANGARRTLGL